MLELPQLIQVELHAVRLFSILLCGTCKKNLVCRINSISTAFDCPSGSVYSICASSCQRSCYQTIVRETCDMDCVEGCEPTTGFVMQNGIPVPERECGCRYGNEYFNVCNDELLLIIALF